MSILDFIMLYDHSSVMFFSIFRPRKNALFLIDLVIDKEGVHFSTNVPSFESTLVSLFDKGIQATQNVPQLEKVRFAVLKLIF